MNAGGARRAAITGLLVVLAHGQFGVDCSAPAGAAHSRRVDEVGTATQTARVYPNGRTLARRYDAIDRLVAVSDTAFGNQTRQTHLDPTRTRDRGYDALAREVERRTERVADGSLVVGFAQGYDAVGNRVFEEKLHDPERSERWSHDSAYRLTSFERGTLGAYTLGAQVVTEVADATPAISASLAARTWQLDGEGSWRAGTERWVDALGNQIGADFSRATSPAHEYLRETRSEGPPGGPLTVSTTAYLHDPSGNLVEDGRFVYLWDALGRLAEVQRPTGEVVARYAYDAFSRRVRKEVTAQALDPTLAGVTLYLHDASQVIEELVSSDPASVPFATARQYVYGRGIDQPVALDRYQAGAGSAPLDLDQLSLVDLGAGVTTQVHRLYYATNALQSVFALTDTAPADAGAGDPGAHLVEAAEYDPYGAHTLYAPAAGQTSVAFDGSDAASSYAAADRAVRSRYDNPYLFTGRRFDPETGLLHYRNRYYDPLLGQFLSQDPSGYADGLNLYEYVGGNPLNAIDPYGYMAQALAGAVAGAAIEGAMGAVGTLLAGGSLTDAAIEGGIGALSGAIRCGLTCAGLPPPLSGAISAAVSAALRTGAKAIRKAIECGSTIDWRALLGEMAEAALTGAIQDLVTGGILQGGGALMKKIADKFGLGARLGKLSSPCAQGLLGAAVSGAISMAAAQLENCFLAGTLVETEHGLVPIEDVAVGDRVLAKDERTGEVGYREVVRLFRNTAEHVVSVTYRPAKKGRSERHSVGRARGGSSEGEGGEDGEGGEPPLAAGLGCGADAAADAQTIRCTPGHVWLVAGRGRVLAGHLQPGDLLESSRGEPLEVVAVALEARTVETFNFEVEGWHTYFVAAREGAPAAWVHNASIQANAAAGAKRERLVEKQLRAANPGAEVQGQRTLRDKYGRIVRDPVTGEARRLDHVVVRKGRIIDVVETTSLTAPKDKQLQKEARIRRAGGRYIRNKRTNKLMHVPRRSRVERRC